MSAGKFWLLTFLSLVIAILIFLEIACEMQVASLTNRVSFAESKVNYARQQNELLRQMVQRIAVLSQHDPALADLLTKRGIHLSNKNSSAATPQAAPALTTPSPSTPAPK